MLDHESELQSQIVTERSNKVLSVKNQKELLGKWGSRTAAIVWRNPQAEDSRCSPDDILSKHIGSFEVQIFFSLRLLKYRKGPQNKCILCA